MLCRRLRAACGLALVLVAGGVAAGEALDAAGDLQRRGKALAAKLRDSPFQQPIVVDSME